VAAFRIIAVTLALFAANVPHLLADLAGAEVRCDADCADEGDKPCGALCNACACAHGVRPVVVVPMEPAAVPVGLLPLISHDVDLPALSAAPVRIFHPPKNALA
jgi:hypothetical protein